MRTSRKDALNEFETAINMAPDKNLEVETNLGNDCIVAEAGTSLSIDVLVPERGYIYFFYIKKVSRIFHRIPRQDL